MVLHPKITKYRNTPVKSCKQFELVVCVVAIISNNLGSKLYYNTIRSIQQHILVLTSVLPINGHFFPKVSVSLMNNSLCGFKTVNYTKLTVMNVGQEWYILLKPLTKTLQQVLSYIKANLVVCFG